MPHSDNSQVQGSEKKVGCTYILFCCDVDWGYCSVDMTHWPSVALVLGRRRMPLTLHLLAINLYGYAAGGKHQLY